VFRVPKTFSAFFDPLSQSEPHDLPRYQFESLDQGVQADSSRIVLVSDDEQPSTPVAIQRRQLDRVANQADIPCVWVQHIHRPVLHLSAIVAEWPNDLELYRPVMLDGQIRSSPGPS
jgi:hypothetical protein